MEHLFSPCTRMFDLLETQGDVQDHIGMSWDDFKRVKELNLDVSTEELMSAERAFTYADVFAMLGNGNEIAWFTERAAVCRQGRAYNYSDTLLNVCSVSFNADGKNMVALALSPEALLEICDVVLRMLVSTKH
jgi:hypothetical protein